MHVRIRVDRAVRRFGGVLALASVCLGVESGAAASRQPRQSNDIPIINTRSVLDEALMTTMKISDRGVQAVALLHIARVRHNEDPAAALELAQNVAKILPGLPEDMTWGDIFKDAFNPLNVLGGVGLYSLYGPYLGNALNTNRSLTRQQFLREAYRSRKVALTQELFELLVPTAPALALATESTLPVAYRAVALEALLRLGPASQAETRVASVKQVIQAGTREIPAPDLARLAEAVHQYDPAASRLLITEALVKVRARNTPEQVLEDVYASAIKVQPDFFSDSAFSAESPQLKAKRQLAFGRGTAATDPQRALAVLKDVTPRSRETREGLAAALRLIAEEAPQDVSTEIRSQALRLVDDSEGITFRVARDAVVALGTVDSGLASERAAALRLEAGRTFENIVRLELALSWLPKRPLQAFEMLESFDDRFWSSLGPTVWGITKNPSWRPELFRPIVRTKKEWPRQAIVVAAQDAVPAERTLRRCTAVARFLDTSAVKLLAKYVDSQTQYRDEWVEYLPFALAEVAVARHQAGDEAALRLLEDAQKLAKSAPRPAREWALGWNARAWQDVAPASRTPILEEAVTSLTRLQKHGKLEVHLPLLLDQVSRLDPSRALQIARSSKTELRPFALTAVASGLRVATSR